MVFCVWLLLHIIFLLKGAGHTLAPFVDMVYESF